MHWWICNSNVFIRSIKAFIDVYCIFRVFLWQFLKLVCESFSFEDILDGLLMEEIMVTLRIRIQLILVLVFVCILSIIWKLHKRFCMLLVLNSHWLLSEYQALYDNFSLDVAWTRRNPFSCSAFNDTIRICQHALFLHSSKCAQVIMESFDKWVLSFSTRQSFIFLWLR